MNIVSYLDSKEINYKLVSGGHEATFSCPSCGGSPGKFSVNTETGAYICFLGSCGIRGSVKDLIKLLCFKKK